MTQRLTLGAYFVDLLGAATIAAFAALVAAPLALAAMTAPATAAPAIPIAIVTVFGLVVFIGIVVIIRIVVAIDLALFDRGDLVLVLQRLEFGFAPERIHSASCSIAACWG